MEDSMTNMQDSVSDEKIGNKRVRDGEDEIHKGRLEKRPSGILGISSDGEDYTGQDGESGGIIGTFISNVFHKNRSGAEDEVEVDGEAKTGVSDDDVECKREDLGVDGDGESGGGGVISAFFSNIFHQNGSAEEDDGDQAKSDQLGGGAAGGVEENGGGEPEDHDAEKLSEKDKLVDLPSKDPTGGNTLKLKPDDYSERVFFLNNN